MNIIIKNSKRHNNHQASMWLKCYWVKLRNKVQTSSKKVVFRFTMKHVRCYEM